MAVEQSGGGKGAIANRRYLLSAVWITEAVILGLGMFLPLIAVIVILLHQDIAANAVWSLGALAAAGLLSGALVLRRAVQREVRVREGDIRQRGLLEYSPDGVVLLDVANGARLYANATAANMFGLSSAEILAADLGALSAPIQGVDETPQAYGAKLIASAMSGKLVDARWNFRRGDGSVFPGRLVLSRLPGEDAVVRAGITDLSRESTLEQSRDQAEERVRALVDNAPEGVMLVDRFSHQIRYANRAAGGIFSADPARLTGQVITRAVLDPQPDGSSPDMLMRAMEAEALHGIESVRVLRLRRGNKAEFDAEVRAFLLPGAADAFRISVIDLSDRLALEAAKSSAEASLRVSESRFRHLAKISTDWYWETGLDDRFSMLDGGSADQRAIMDQFVGRLPWEVRRLESLDPDWHAVRECRTRRQAYIQVLRFQVPERPDQSARILEIVADPIFDVAGTYLGYRGVARDITERYQAQERQRIGEETARALAEEHAAAVRRLELIVHSLPVAFMVRDAQHRITHWNPEAERVFGFTEAEALGKFPADLIVPPELCLSDTQRLATIGRGGEMTSSVLDNLTKSGMRIQCEWRNAPITGANGEFAGSIGMALDITTRIHTENALKESEAHFRRLTELASDYKWETDAEHRFVELIADADGVTRTDALGKCRWELPHVRPLSCSWEEHRAALESHQSLSNMLVEVTGADGRRYYRMLNGEPKFDSHGAFSGYRGVGIDVSRSHRENLRRAGEARLFDALSRGEPLVDLMTILCEVVEASTERPSRASMLFVESGRLRHLTAPRLSEAYRNGIDGMAVGETVGCCGAAVAHDRTVITEDIAVDANWRPYRELAGATGVRACWSTPVRGIDGRVIATFAVYTDVPAKPAGGDLDVTDAAARLAALVMERHHAAEGLRASEERLRQLLTISADWEWEQDAQFRFTRTSIWQGNSRGFLATSVGKTRWENRQLRPIGFTWEQHRRLLEAHEPFSHILVEFTNAAGRRFYWALRGEPVFDAHGAFKGYRGVGSDITARYRIDTMRLGEGKLFESLAQGEALPALAQSLAQTISDVLEAQGAVVIKELVRGALQVIGSFGVPPAWSEVLARGMALEQDATTCAEAARLNRIAIIEDVGSNARCAPLRAALLDAGIGGMWSVPVVDRAGAVIATVGIATPVAAAPTDADVEFVRAAGRLAGFVIERFRSTEAARDSAERYRRLVEQSQDGVLIHDWGIIEYANPAFVRMVGAKDLGGLIGLNAVKFYTRDSQTRSIERLARLRETGDTLSFAEMQLQRLDGGVVEVEVAASVFESHGHKRVQSQFRDIGARKWTEREILNLNRELEQRVTQRTTELTAANRELEAFSYTVAHDLRAPLRAIDGFSQLLKGDLGAELTAEAQRDIDAISASARKMSELINGLLEFSRYGRGVLAGQRVITQALVAAAAEEAGRGRNVLFDIGELEDTHGDPVMLRQVWVNLVGNAVKFSSRKDAPCVSIRCSLSEQDYLFSVSDNGDGFDMAYVDKLFGVFQRLHSAGEFEGTGVGLAIVKRIVERHGGRIWAESTPGAGAVFRFTLPRHDAVVPASVRQG